MKSLREQLVALGLCDEVAAKRVENEARDKELVALAARLETLSPQAWEEIAGSPKSKKHKSRKPRPIVQESEGYVSAVAEYEQVTGKKARVGVDSSGREILRVRGREILVERKRVHA